MNSEWPTVTLGEVVEVLDHMRKPVTKSDRIPGEVPYFGATGVQDHVSDYLFNEDLVLVGEDGAKWGQGDRTAYKISGPAWVNNHAHVLRPMRNRLMDDWLVFLLEYLDLSQYVSGVTVPKLNQANLRQIQIPLPPLEEQHRIVARLEAALSVVDELQSNAERSLAELEVLWASSLEHALNSEGRRLPLGALGNWITGATPKTSDARNFADEVWFVTPGDIGSGGKLRAVQRRISAFGAQSIREIRPNSVLLVCIGTIGKVAWSDQMLTTNQQINALEVDERAHSVKYVHWLLASPSTQAKLKAMSVSTTVPILNKRKLEQIEVSLPPLEEQNRIVAKLDEVKDLIDSEREVLKLKIQDSGKLRSLILTAAFNGEL